MRLPRTDATKELASCWGCWRDKAQPPRQDGSPYVNSGYGPDRSPGMTCVATSRFWSGTMRMADVWNSQDHQQPC